MSFSKNFPNLVLFSSEQSIKQKKISLLALLEIPLAFVVWIYIAKLNPWPLLSIFAFLAVPILLLRSPLSIREGVKELSNYRGRSWGSDRDCIISKGQKIFAALVGATFVVIWGIFIYQGVLSFVDEYPVIKFLIIVIVGAIVGVSGGIVISLNSIVVIAVVMPLIFLTTFFGGISVAAVVPWVGMLLVLLGVGFAIAFSVLQIDSQMEFAAVVAEQSVFVGLFAPAYAFGVFVRTLFIKVFASVKYIWVGLNCWPANLREILLCVDSVQMPMLLPRADRVAEEFGLKYWINQYTQRPDSPLWERAILFLAGWSFVVLIYFPALAYRLNIKATAWLWGVIAWVLGHKRWPSFEAMRVGMIVWIHWFTLSIVGISSGIGLVLVSSSILPQAINNWASRQIPSELLPLAGDLPGWHSLRGLLFGLTCFGLLLLCFQSLRVYLPHKKAWESGREYKEEDLELRKAMIRGAEKVHFLLRFNTLMIVLSVWVWGLWLAIRTPWGQESKAFIWQFLIPFL